jgi:excisionase family DNA binding protein
VREKKILCQLYGVDAAAAMLGLSVWTLRSWAYSGKIASHKIGNRLLISAEELAKIVQESERPRIARNDREPSSGEKDPDSQA